MKTLFNPLAKEGFDSVGNGGSGTTNDKGWFENEAALILALPVGQTGWYALIEDTDTFWKRDVDTTAWIDTGIAPSDTYNGVSPANQAFGGISVGYNPTGKTRQNILQDAMVAYIPPTFTSFAIGQSTPIEVGTTISGSKTFTWGTSQPGNITPNSLIIRDQTAGLDLATGLSNDGSEVVNIGSVQKIVATSNTWRISALQTVGGPITRDTSVSWQWRRFYGEDTNGGPLTEAQIEALRVSGLASGFAGAYSFNALTSGYKYLAYPVAFGTATVFKDAGTNLDVPMLAVYTVSVTNSLGITTTYNVHRTLNPMGGAFVMNVS